MSTDAQTWEFSHHKFLRARPDLLDEIKRKALEPDPSIKHRVELPGEVAAQLNQMREQNRRVVRALDAERAKVDRLVRSPRCCLRLFQKLSLDHVRVSASKARSRSIGATCDDSI